MKPPKDCLRSGRQTLNSPLVKNATDITQQFNGTSEDVCVKHRLIDTSYCSWRNKKEWRLVYCAQLPQFETMNCLSIVFGFFFEKEVTFITYVHIDKASSVQEPCIKCLAVNVLKFEILLNNQKFFWTLYGFSWSSGVT